MMRVLAQEEDRGETEFTILIALIKLPSLSHLRLMTDTLPTIVGRRVQLRSFTDSDVPALLSIFGDAAVSRFMGIPQLHDATDARALLESIHSGRESKTLYQWGVVALDVDNVVGTCTLANISWQHERAELGFAVGTAHQRKGYMAEALLLLLDHAFSDLRLNRIEADVDPRNERSLRLLDRLGFDREGYLRQRHLVNGERQDSVLLGLLASTWAGRRQFQA